MRRTNTVTAISEYDFVEFGTSKGRSLAFAIENLGGKNGLGIDINPKKVAMTQAAGFDCVLADVTTLDFPDNSVFFVVLSHFLEHLPDLGTVERCIASAARLASGFLFIRGPCFDSEAYLNSNGFKSFYADWKGHPCHLTSKMLCNILVNNKLTQFDLRFKGLTQGSSDRFIHPLESPPDQNKYNPKIHPPKKSLRFTQPVYKEMICFVKVGDVPNWGEITSSIDGTVKPGHHSAI